LIVQVAIFDESKGTVDASILFEETEICTRGGKETFPVRVFEWTVFDEIGLFRMFIEREFFIALNESFDV
jgi:hypothetical protein